MNKDKIRQFTVRITESNRTELIAVMYDMMETYFDDAYQAWEHADNDAFKQHIRGADRVLKELSDILDFKYEISGNLYALYTWCRQQLSLTITRNNLTGIENAKRVLIPLGDSFRKLAKEDQSGPIMKNRETVTYGATYGRSDITESVGASDTNRGYFA